MATKIEQFIDITKMYETCDIVIEMIDSNYWEVFSNDPQLINRFRNKFKDLISLEPDFLA